MPNVMGREFPYTPQGMAEAQQYRQALGMRDGGSMGFRPVGYADGDAVDVNMEIYLAFNRALKEIPEENLNQYMYDNLGDLKSMADENPARGDLLAAVMNKTGFEGYMRTLMQGAGRVGRDFGDSRISDRDLEQLRALGGDFSYPPAQRSPPAQMQGLPQDVGVQQTLPPMQQKRNPPQQITKPTQQMRNPPQQITTPTQQMRNPPQGIEDFPGYDPNTNEYFPPQMSGGGIMSLRGY